MSDAPRVLIVRHAKERLRKCSLRPLHGHPWLEFRRATKTFSLDATGYTELAVDAPALSPADAGRPLLLLDATWRHLPALKARIDGETIPRSIPGGIATRYPRVSRHFEEPEQGLASVEALYVALKVLGFDDPGILDSYHWKTEFLASVAAAGL